MLDSTKAVAQRLQKGQLVVLESTTYPGTTDEECLPILEATGLKTPDDFLLAFSPEREDPGNPDFHTKTIPKVVGGVNKESTEASVALYQAAIDTVVAVSSSRVAESSKLLENIFRSINIALVNELKMTFDRMGIDIWEVIEAAKTKPFGFKPFYPGPGLGGHCIPLDPFYLSWKAAEYGIWTRFIELAGEINTHMPHYVIEKTVKALNEAGKSINGAKVLVLGLSYKEDIDDDRESPSYEIIELLQEAGAKVEYCDPYFPKARHGRKHKLEMTLDPLHGRRLCRLRRGGAVDRPQAVQGPGALRERGPGDRHAQRGDAAGRLDGNAGQGVAEPDVSYWCDVAQGLQPLARAGPSADCLLGRRMPTIASESAPVVPSSVTAGEWDSYVSTHPDASGYHQWCWRGPVRARLRPRDNLLDRSPDRGAGL